MGNEPGEALPKDHRSQAQRLPRLVRNPAKGTGLQPDNIEMLTGHSAVTTKSTYGGRRLDNYVLMLESIS